MKKDCKVSIITVVYNGAKTLEKTIQSVLNQTYKNIEYIVIDGQSTDGTQLIIEKYMDAIAYYISEKDKGLYYAMNKGLRQATGDIIGIINSDDWYVKNAVNDIVVYFQENVVDLVYGQIIAVSEHNKESIYQNIALESMWYRMALPHPSVFVKKGVYDKLGGFDVNYKFAADYELLLRFYSEEIRFGYIDKVIAYFREGGLSTKRKKEMYNESYRISMSYAERCPYKEQVYSKIEETLNWSYFCMDIQNFRELLSELLYIQFGKIITSIIIFGTGVWAKKCYENLTDTGIEILYFVDNDMSKWGMNFCGIKVISPRELQYTDTPVLIAVKEYGEQIKRQLERDDNTKLKCVSIKELEQIYLIKYMKL